MNGKSEQFESLMRIGREARIDSALLADCIERRLLPMDGDDWGDSAYFVACRVRRLTQLGVNMQGIEVVLGMRARLLQLQSELESMHAELKRVQRERDQEVARLMRELTDRD